ncbi:MAG: ABC transporter permease [Chloroflexota bacterium]
MPAYILKRLISLAPVLMVVALVVFGILRLTPGDPAAVMLGDNATATDIERLRRTLGLDQPLPVQFVSWMANILRGDLGYSIFLDRPVTQAIAERLQPTILLTLYALIIAVSIALPAGAIAAARQGSWLDRALMVFSLLGVSLPEFLTGMLMIMVFAVALGWMPSEGYRPLSDGLFENFRSLLMPAIALGMSQAALIARTTRASVLEVLKQDYVQTARAKGLSERAVMWRHVLRNAALPIATVVGLSYAVLMGGAIIVETVFNLPGMGRLVINSVMRRDYPVVQGVVLFVAMIYVGVNLAVDILYKWLDPRVKY